MKNTNTIRTATVAGGMSLAAIISASAATTLTGDTTTANNTVIPVAHGSNEVGTPNITLAWSSPDAEWQSWDNWNGRGDTYQIDAAVANNSYLISFTPDAGFNAQVTSLDIDMWSGGNTGAGFGDYVVNWDVSGATSGSLDSGQSTIGTVGLNPITFTGATGTGSEVVTLTLSLDATSLGRGGYLAMDNLAFDQVAVAVPEPASTALVALGLGAAAMRRRR